MSCLSLVSHLYASFLPEKHEFNHEMLQELASEVHEIMCTDEIDQTSSTQKWTKKATEQLEKLAT